MGVLLSSAALSSVCFSVRYLNSRRSGTDELPLFVSLWFYRKRICPRAPPRGAPYTSGALHGGVYNTDGVFLTFYSDDDTNVNPGTVHNDSVYKSVCVVYNCRSNCLTLESWSSLCRPVFAR